MLAYRVWVRVDVGYYKGRHLGSGWTLAYTGLSKRKAESILQEENSGRSGALGAKIETIKL
jgi:hypothetical protein